ncbi:MAG: hypothetical protein LBO21_00995 [Synergistaceae bacterium]|jgi:2-methylaconitate cis-trans-isomerase PrpF|nr:hypothetical protein [Synergistaceae bacterium]
MNEFKFTLMRGGTSKGVFFLDEDMPSDRSRWEEFLLDVMGSPDARQIDGLGGANPLTSKAAIVKRSDLGCADVDYTFAQVSLTGGTVDFKSNCGNISSAVGPYSVNKCLVRVSDGRAAIRIFNTNTKKIIVSEFEARGGRFIERGNTSIPGVPGAASPVTLLFDNPKGAVTGKLLPTGRPVDLIETSRGKLAVSIVDSANPLVFMRACDIGLDGTELPAEFSSEMLLYIEEVRSIAAEMCNLSPRADATKKTPAVPNSTIVGPPKPYVSSDGSAHAAAEMDISVRMMAMQRPHDALAITGAICIATASSIEGTLVNEIAPRGGPAALRIAHPGGIMETELRFGASGVDGVKVLRTARSIAHGTVYTKGDY